MLDHLKSLVMDNFMIKVISVFFAVLLWLYVSSKDGEERTGINKNQNEATEAGVVEDG